MGFRIAYQRLLQVHFWHHHLLDSITASGEANLFRPPNANNNGGNSTARTASYDIREWIALRPDAATAAYFKSSGLVFKTNASGGFVASRQSFTFLDADQRLTFLVGVKHPNLFAFSDLPDLGNVPRPFLFYLSNFGADVRQRRLLTAGGGGVLRQSHFLARAGRVLRLRLRENFAPPPASLSVAVFNALPEDTAPAPVPDWAVANFTISNLEAEQTHIELDCRHLRSGIYRVEATDLHPDQPTTLYLGQEEQAQLWGVIDLFPFGWENSQFDIRLAKN